VRVSEPNALLGQPVDIWRRDSGFRIERSNITVPEVVGKNEQHVRQALPLAGGHSSFRTTGQQQ
jgi:hypothetical protein